MPSIVISVTEKNLLRISTEPDKLAVIQDKIEDELALTMARGMTQLVKRLETGFIEVVWVTPTRTKRAADFAVSFEYSEKVTPEDTGFVTTPQIRAKLRELLLTKLETTKLLPQQLSVSSWVKPIYGGTYDDGKR